MTSLSNLASSCSLCINNKEFIAYNSLALKYGRKSTPARMAKDNVDKAFERFGDDMLPIDEIALYKNDIYSIIRDVQKEDKTHLLVVSNIHLVQPSQAVMYPEIFMPMMLAAVKIANSIKSEESKIQINSVFVSERPQGHEYSMLAGFDEHFHIQIHSPGTITREEIVAVLSTP